MGTLSHYAAFAKNGARLTVILRVPEDIVYPQLIINEIRQLDWYLVEATKTPLPTIHSRSFSLFVPTKYFNNYLDYVKDDYMIEELDNTDVIDTLFIRYMKEYALAYANPSRFKLIASKNMFDVINCMNVAFYGEALDSKKYPLIKQEISLMSTQSFPLKKCSAFKNKVKKILRKIPLLRYLKNKIKKIKPN